MVHNFYFLRTFCCFNWDRCNIWLYLLHTCLLIYPLQGLSLYKPINHITTSKPHGHIKICLQYCLLIKLFIFLILSFSIEHFVIPLFVVFICLAETRPWNVLFVADDKAFFGGSFSFDEFFVPERRFVRGYDVVYFF